MQLFYSTEVSEEQLVLDEEETKHATKVLRKGIGDQLTVTNGLGHIFHCTIEQQSKKSSICHIGKKEKQPERPYKLHIAIAPTKSNNRFEWFLEKATEIGVDEIIPLICSNSERKKINVERMNRILVGAMKQAKLAYLPKLNQPMVFNDFISSLRTASNLIAHCHNRSLPNIVSKAVPSGNTCVLIGPEGDFTQEEVQKAIGEGFVAVSLGATRLRTETAGIFAASALALKQVGD